jgi:hypothetical protein
MLAPIPTPQLLAPAQLRSRPRTPSWQPAPDTYLSGLEALATRQQQHGRRPTRPSRQRRPAADACLACLAPAAAGPHAVCRPPYSRFAGRRPRAVLPWRPVRGGCAGRTRALVVGRTWGERGVARNASVVPKPLLLRQGGPRLAPVTALANTPPPTPLQKTSRAFAPRSCSATCRVPVHPLREPAPAGRAAPRRRAQRRWERRWLPCPTARSAARAPLAAEPQPSTAPGPRRGAPSRKWTQQHAAAAELPSPPPPQQQQQPHLAAPPPHSTRAPAAKVGHRAGRGGATLCGPRLL